MFLHLCRAARKLRLPGPAQARIRLPQQLPGLPLTENFESYSLGAFAYGTGGWATTGAGASIVNTVAANGTSQSISLSNSTGIIKGFSNTGSITYFEFYVRATGTGYPVLQAYNGTTAIDPIFNFSVLGDIGGTIEIDGYDGTNTETLIHYSTGVTFAADTWYKIKIEVNSASGALNIWVNDANQTTGSTLTADKQPAQVQFAGFGSTCYYDEINIHN